jgi:hypothetical protein
MSMAEALGRKYVRISMAASVRFGNGEESFQASGQIIKALIKTKVKIAYSFG